MLEIARDLVEQGPSSLRKTATTIRKVWKCSRSNPETPRRLFFLSFWKIKFKAPQTKTGHETAAIPLNVKPSEDDDDDFSNDMSQEMFDWITSDTYTQTKVASGVMQRYSKINPAKAVSQLCTAISKWTKDYLQ